MRLLFLPELLLHLTPILVLVRKRFRLNLSLLVFFVGKRLRGDVQVPIFGVEHWPSGLHVFGRDEIVERVLGDVKVLHF